MPARVARLSVRPALKQVLLIGWVLHRKWLPPILLADFSLIPACITVIIVDLQLRQVRRH